MKIWSRLGALAAVVGLLVLPSNVLAGQAVQGKTSAMTVGVRILSPASGTVVRGHALTLSAAFTHWKLNCAWAGKPNKAGVGHYHVLLDGALVNMFCNRSASISMQNVKPGKHMLTVIPADNHHSDMMFMQAKEMQQLSFAYRPAHAMPWIKPVNLGKPSVSITSPKNGATVSGTFPLTISVHNFHLSSALYGKQNVTGYGHWHANIDSTMGPMMGMATMLGMSDANTFTVSTVGIKPGMHKFYALLTDNQHAPLMKPGTEAFVTLNVK